MRTRILVAIAAILTLAAAGPFSTATGAPQQVSPKKGRAPKTSTVPSETQVRNRAGEPGGMDDTITMDHMSAVMQVDSMMQRMTGLIERTESCSKSFGLLAAAHHGADKREILMMQRMSDSMGTMAEEINVSLQQYKEMLESETTSESGKMKAEVQGFRIILDGIARDIEAAVNTLHALDEQLGQG